jgi:hypothetical protein
MPKTNQINQTNQTNQTNQNNIGIYLLYGGASLFILGCIFVFFILPMFQKKTSVDCSGYFTEWTACDATCDGINVISSKRGKKTRTYIVTTPASNGGISCPISPEIETCTKTDCQVNCIGKWNDWSACDATCDGINAISSRTGIRKRTYSVTTPASNGGVSCPISPETETCTKTDCPINCIGKWNDWSDCDATCDGINAISSRTGIRKRTYSVTTPASNGGISCPISPETETCTKTDCQVNCIGKWNDWSACDATCDGTKASVTGIITRTYTVITPTRNKGISCPISPEIEKCTKTDCPVNCIGKWSEWSNCDSTCDGINTISSIPGRRSRTFLVTTTASNNGSCPISPEIDSKCIKSGCLVKIIAMTTTPVILVGLNSNESSSGDKYIVFNYTSDSIGLIGQTEYTFNVTNNNINAMILIVAGGGGGGNNGGGGGGGDVSLNNITLPIGNHKIRVGKGGQGGVIAGTIGQKGYNSELILQSGITYTYCGGGGGGTWDTASTPGSSNGYSSGGGGGGACGARGGDSACYAGGSGNGFSGNGGAGGSESTGKGGGGGAAPGTVGNGGNGANGNGGNGGKGVTSNITGTDVGYGGGGSGSAYPNKTPGIAFDGGGTGGRGRPIDGFEAASAGINGTGGGGGGGFSAGANGGNGVIIIRYNA